jgi:hypothetical protein
MNVRIHLTKTQRLKRKFIQSFKTECYLCGRKKNLSFHHMDKSKKVFTLGSEYSLTKNHTELTEEIMKCVVLCRDCHDDVDENRGRDDSTISS